MRLCSVQWIRCLAVFLCSIRFSVDLWCRDGHCTRFLRLPDSVSGHIVVSSFLCSQRLAIEFCDRFHGLSDTINRVSSIIFTCASCCSFSNTGTHQSALASSPTALRLYSSSWSLLARPMSGLLSVFVWVFFLFETHASTVF